MKRTFIIGTAGHVDHGKTTLIRALTGRDTDRLAEEKRRGISIDLGFTWMELEDGMRIGIVDVPGHEKLIHNMAAGASGMDAVLLVIAADEGVMPQTLEHMAILEFLGAERFIIVLNKCDLAEEAWLELVEEEIRQDLSGTKAETAPIVRVSAAEGTGLEALRREIGRLTFGQKDSHLRITSDQNSDIRGDQEKEIGMYAGLDPDLAGLVRFPVDRVFTVPGFGTVATGTVVQAQICTGDELSCLPSGRMCRVRGIQTYGEETDRCFAGQRAALNLSGIEKQEIRRGCVLVSPGSLTPVRYVNVRLHVWKRSGRQITNRMRMHFYSGTQELLCRVILLDTERLSPGESGYAQICMESEAVLCPGDRFVVRFYSPMETVGGGEVLEVTEYREKRFRESVLSRLLARERGDLPAVIEDRMKLTLPYPADSREIASASSLTKRETAQNLPQMCVGGSLICIEQGSDSRGELPSATDPAERETDREVPERFYIHVDVEKRIRERTFQETAAYHDAFPFRPGIPLAELAAVVFPKCEKSRAELYLGWLSGQGELGVCKTASGNAYFLPEWEDETERFCSRAGERITQAAEEAGCRFLDRAGVWEQFHQIQEEPYKSILANEQQCGEALRLMEQKGKLVHMSDGFYTVSSIISSIVRQIRDLLERDGKVTIAQVRDLCGGGRKHAKLILDYTDRLEITEKSGAESERIRHS